MRNLRFEQWLRCHNYDPARLHPAEERFLYSVFQAETEQPRAASVRPTPTAAGQGWDIRAAAAVQTSAPPADALAITGRASIQAAAGGSKERTFEIVAYTGEPMILEWWDYPVILDLEGIDAGDGVIPILDNHGPRPYSDESVRPYFVGQSAAIEVTKGKDGSIVIRGKFFGSSAAAKEIIALADDGAAFQASVGARAMQRDFIAEGNTVEVNGRTFEGPVYVSRLTKLRETSIVVMGADEDTSVVVARKRRRSSPMPKNKTVTAKAASFAEYCKAMDIDEAKLSEQAKAALKAVYDDDEDDDDDDPKDGDAKGKPGNLLGKERLPIAQPISDGELQKLMRVSAAAEVTRINAIRAVCTEFPGVKVKNEQGAEADLEATAIAEGWDRDRAELLARRNTRPVPSPHWYAPSVPEASEAVLEAAVLQAGNCKITDRSKYAEHGVPDFLRDKVITEHNSRYTDKVMQAAHSMFKGRIGLQQFLLAAAGANGKRVPTVMRDDGDIQQMLRAANWDIRAEGASTVSLQNALANVLNKFLLPGYMFADNSYRQICAVRPTKDFKPTKSVNIFGDFLFKKLGDDGQLQAAAMSDEAFSNQVDTWGRLLSLSRKILINDDMSCLTTVPMLVGLGAVEALSLMLWTLWNSPGNGPDGNAFWYARNASVNQLGGGAYQTNLLTGGSSALSSASLQTAYQQMLKQVKPNGNPLGVMPKLLVVPPELDQSATELMTADYLVGTGQTSNTRQPNTNIWKGRFQKVMSPYLSNSTITGYSTTAWWLLASPDQIAAIELAFLNGQENPTVQTAQADFDRLGILVRGYFDPGVNMQNVRAGQKSNGV